jgi:predicted secreted protein
MLKYFIMILVLLVSLVPSLSEASPFTRWNLDMLGFSANSKYFVIVESVTEAGSGIARAKLMVKNVATNQCVRGGCLFASGSEKNLGTEKMLLRQVYRKTWKIRKNRQLTPPRGGYRAEGPFFEEDCNSAYYLYDNQKIVVRMQQKSSWPQKASVQLEVSVGNLKKKLDSLDNYREDAQKYQLGYLFVSPNKRSLVILVYVFYQAIEGQELTTIVQTTRLF